MLRDELVAYLDAYLRIDEFGDYGPQGLQVEGREEVAKITSSVDSALPVLKAAVAARSDLHLVHHGLFWGDPQLLKGPLGERVRILMQAEVNLYAAHLALDAHPEVGNNVVLAQLLGIEVVERWSEAKGNLIGVVGEASAGLALEQLVERVNRELNIEARVAAHGKAEAGRIGIVSGGAAGDIGQAAGLGIDTFITGETSHANFWDAAAHGINVIYAGHYATETVGVKALGAHLGAKFDLPVEFIDFPTGL